MTNPHDPNQQPDDSGAYPPQGQPGGAFPPPQGQPGGTYPGPQAPGGPVPPAGPGMPGIPGMPQPEPQKSKLPQILIAVLVVLVVVGGVIWYVVAQGKDPSSAKVGDCINYASESDVSIVACDSDDAQYKVQKRIDGDSSLSACEDVADADLSIYPQSDSGDQYSLCLSLIAEEGDCISSGGDVVSCDDDSAYIRVDKVLTGTSDTTQCPEGTQGRPYEADQQVYCFASANS